MTRTPPSGAGRGGSLLGAAAAAALALPTACHGEADEARRAEAGRVAEAVRVLRDAPREGRRPLLKALEAVACTARDVCDLKKTCADAYAAEQHALDAVSAVRRAASGDAPVAAGAAALVGQAEVELARSRDGGKKCADLEGEARRRYSL